MRRRTYLPASRKCEELHVGTHGLDRRHGIRQELDILTGSRDGVGGTPAEVDVCCEVHVGDVLDLRDSLEVGDDTGDVFSTSLGLRAVGAAGLGGSRSLRGSTDGW